MVFNPLILFLAALIPMAVGFVWYHPKVMGEAWMKASGVTPEMAKGGNMAVIFGVSFLFAFMMSTFINGVVIHQNHFFSTLMNEPGLQDPNSEVGRYAADFVAKYGKNFRTFKHGVFHGVIAAIFFGLPLLGTTALFERKTFKYIFINFGYWAITLGLMGGVICAFS